MKAELVDVNDTRKSLSIEVPREVVDAEIDRVARDYGRKARIPGFRPGKAPSRVIKQRFKAEILHDVLHELVPRVLGEALQQRGVEAVNTPDVRDVSVDEGQPLTFTASFDTVPAFDPGDFSTISLKRPSAAVDDAGVDAALERLGATVAPMAVYRWDLPENIKPLRTAARSASQERRNSWLCRA